MGGNLKDAIGGGIENGATCAYVFFAEFLNDLGTGSRLVPYHFAPNSLSKGSTTSGGKPCG